MQKKIQKSAIEAYVKADVGLGNVDNTSDASKPVSMETSSALALKAPLASPAFTGVVAAPNLNSTGEVSVITSTCDVRFTLQGANGGVAPTYKLKNSAGAIKARFGIAGQANGLSAGSNPGDLVIRAEAPNILFTSNGISSTASILSSTQAIFSVQMSVAGKITNMTDPAQLQDAATKYYVDNLKRMVRIYNVKDYRAVGNNVADDVSAVQAAVDACNVADDLENQLQREKTVDDLELRAKEERLRIGRLTVRDRVRALAGTGGSVTLALNDSRWLTLSPHAFGKDRLAADILPSVEDAPVNREQRRAQAKKK
ncbi:hypothetical protein HQQ80_21640 [Microbacteriaceae bacterium VKM Ac-2855]|nr:hypothetical protein [Microbacteriaceae bacterium VKM Ac-2855]